MSKAKYQLLPKSDQTPAVEVSLSSVPVNDIDTLNERTPNETMYNLSQQNVSLNGMSEINLDDNVDLTTPAALLTNNTPTNDNLPCVDATVNTNLPPASELPSYNEALRLKKLECNEIPPSYYASVPVEEARITIDPVDLRAIALAEATDSLSLDNEIGSECMFLSAFMIAFFFNWVGFFASICLLPNAAGKYGALSGFGLSMAKWVTIVRYQEWMTNMNDFQQKLFFWLFIFLGFYLFFRGLINFMSLKYRPRSTNLAYSRRHRERLFGLIE